tara:strand:- start:9299 stop:10021 length:723 start_codon:yes stop_codon:yes gene_type:complete
MAVIANIQMESGSPSEWTLLYRTGTGGVDVAQQAALANTRFGLQCLVDTTGDKAYGQKSVTHNTDIFRMRFYFDPSGLTQGVGEKFPVMTGNAAATTTYQKIELHGVAGSGYEMSIGVRSDGLSWTDSTKFAITDAVHLIEAQWTQADNDSSSNATAEIWVDGVSEGTVSGVDLYDGWDLDFFRMGQINLTDAGTNGNIYVDQIVVNDNGAYIGPHNPGSRNRSRIDGSLRARYSTNIYS